MKKILITGADSYIGTSFEKWVAKEPTKYSVDTIDARAHSWRERDFSPYDVVFHVAGIAHQDTKADQKDLYYKVNTDLTIEAAKKAKADGVKQFIFMSSMIVYGASSEIGKPKVITKETVPQPANFYGDSKLQAENGIRLLQSDNFNVVIVRPPMIYGRKSKGNYPLLSKIAKITPFFPDIDNQKSMLHINNLTEFVRLMIVNEEHGIFHPQNEEIITTSEIVKSIREVNQQNIFLTKKFNSLLYSASKHWEIINKVFGNLCYDPELSIYKNEYRVVKFKESILLTEKGV